MADIPVERTDLYPLLSALVADALESTAGATVGQACDLLRRYARHLDAAERAAVAAGIRQALTRSRPWGAGKLRRSWVEALRLLEEPRD